MSNRFGKLIQMALYILHSMVFAAVYGIVSYFVVYRGLAGSDVLFAYLWHIVLIFVFLILDKIANAVLLSSELVINKENYVLAAFVFTLNSISFKTTLYLFYTFILIVSRVTLLYPNPITYPFRGFVLSIEYCLILVVTLDKFIEHLTKDEQRIKRISLKFTKFDKLHNYIEKKRKKKALQKSK